MSASCAIVTLTIGDEHRNRWLRRCDENWRRYAERHGYDLIRFDEPLDDSPRAWERSPSWQKLLILDQPELAGYEQVVWLDSDILFGEEAECIADRVPLDRVGAVNEVDVPSPDLLNHLHPEPVSAYHEAAGLPGDVDGIVQGGLLVVSPAHHREILRRVYDRYEDPGPNLNFEMRPLSYELQRAGLVKWLDRRFNLVWPLYRADRYPFLATHPRHPRAYEAIQNALAEVHCLHFAGCAEEMDWAFDDEARRRAADSRSRRNEIRVETPVVMLTFARPDTTRQVLDAVREVKPSRLLVVANAPRPEAAGEAERFEETRALFDTVDWDCEISTNLAESHLDIDHRIGSGLDWAFGLVPEAIVLEDDCLPHPTFFAFCDALLDRYRDTERVMSICGDNFLFDRRMPANGYYLSRHFHSWGWASWRRAWGLFDGELGRWPDLRGTDWLERTVSDSPHAVAYWSHMLERAHREGNGWDAAWLFTSWVHDAVHAIPNVNLVTNIGFREDATNTRAELRGAFNDLPREATRFPLDHPATLDREVEADAYVESIQYSGVIREVFKRIRTARRREDSMAAG
jgi:hypothetical protein